MFVGTLSVLIYHHISNQRPQPVVLLQLLVRRCMPNAFERDRQKSDFDCMLLLTCRMELCNTILRSCYTRSSRGAFSLEQACQAREGSQWNQIKVDQV